MATQKEMREMRENVIEQVSVMDLQGYEFQGVITDGVLMYNTQLQAYMVLKPIAKKESFDADDALQEYVDKQEAIKQREIEKLEKAQKRAEKAKEELEKVAVEGE